MASKTKDERADRKHTAAQLEAAKNSVHGASPDMFDPEGRQVKFVDTVANDDSPIAYRFKGDGSTFIHGLPLRDLTELDVATRQLKVATRDDDPESPTFGRINGTRDVTKETIEASGLWEKKS